MPGFLLFQNSLRKGGSVAACWVTSYWVGVSLRLSSAEEGFWKWSILEKVTFVEIVCWAGAGAAVCDWAGEHPQSISATEPATVANAGIVFSLSIINCSPPPGSRNLVQRRYWSGASTW